MAERAWAPSVAFLNLLFSMGSSDWQEVGGKAGWKWGVHSTSPLLWVLSYGVLPFPGH